MPFGILKILSLRTAVGIWILIAAWVAMVMLMIAGGGICASGTLMVVLK